MNCNHCKKEVPDDVEICTHCGAVIRSKEKSWHSVNTFLWGNENNQDIFETLDKLNHKKSKPAI